MTDNLQRLLDTDPLAEAEKITGKSYKEDDETMRLGFGMHALNAAAKERALRAADDTPFTDSWFNTMRVFSELGFSIVHQHKFDGNHPGETFVVLWRPDGVLAKAESYGLNRNTADIFYNWRPAEDIEPWGIASSGSFHRESYDLGDKVWVGQHDVREGLRHKLARLEENGKFLVPWVGRPFLWLLDYSQPKADGYDYAAINETVIATLPEHVRNAITPEV